MPQGLQVFGADGVERMRITDRYTRYVGTYSVSISAGGTQDISAPCTTDGTWAVMSNSLRIAVQIFDGFVRAFNCDSLNARSSTFVLVRV